MSQASRQAILRGTEELHPSGHSALHIHYSFARRIRMSNIDLHIYEFLLYA